MDPGARTSPSWARTQRRSSPSPLLDVRPVPAWHNFTTSLLRFTTILYLFSISLLRVITFYCVFTACYHLVLLSYNFLLRCTKCWECAYRGFGWLTKRTRQNRNLGETEPFQLPNIQTPDAEINEFSSFLIDSGFEISLKQQRIRKSGLRVFSLNAYGPKCRRITHYIFSMFQIFSRFRNFQTFSKSRKSMTAIYTYTYIYMLAPTTMIYHSLRKVSNSLKERQLLRSTHFLKKSQQFS